MKRLILLFAIIFCKISLFSQTGPAGVGSSTSNILWVQSEDLSALNNGDRIASWADKSGNSNDLTQSNNSYKPEYVTNQQNGFPAVRFNQTNNRLIKNSFSDFPTSAITVFIINKNNGENDDGIFSYASSSSDNDFLLFDSDALRLYRGSNVTSALDFSNNAWHIIDASWKSSGGNVEICKDNDFSSSYTSTLSNGTNITAGGCLAVGAEQDAVNGNYAAYQTHSGDFLEIIMYNTVLNKAQRIIVSNYLAAKYNLTISNDYYSYQSSHGNKVAGIGRYDASNTHTAAQSAGILTIDNASDMTTDGEYLLFGHDGGSIAAWTTTEKAADNTQRIAREWRLDETGDVGTVDFTIDVSDLPSLPSGYTKYGLMIDSDGDFSTGATIYEMTATGSDYEATGISIADGDYVCIAVIKPTFNFTTSSGSELENNDCVAEVSLNYTTATAVSVDYTTSDGTATAGSDYTGASGATLNFAADTHTADITISVTDDATNESNEDFDITISNPSTGINIGNNNVYNHNILDNDNSRKIYFTSASSNGSEATTTVNLSVEINIADNSNSTTVDYYVSGGTATGGGVDYTLASGTATITSGNTTTNISISINNDALDEDNETIIVKLTNPSSNCNLSSTNPIEHTYTINDDDATPTIQFTTSSSSGLESVGTKNVQLTLSAASGKDVSVNFSTSGTATEGGDYSISSSPATIAAGSTTTNISLTITNDNLIEGDETVIISISSPNNATLGSNTSHTYTILNDDTYGYAGPGGVGKSDNLKLWVKAEDIPGSADGDRISSWADKSGNSNNLSQSNSSYQPAYYDDVVNSYPVARFNQTNNRLIHNSFSDFPTSEISSMFVNKSSGESNDGLLSYATSSSDNEYLIFNSNNVTTYRGSNNNNSGENISDNTWKLFMNTWSNNGDNSKVYVDGDIKHSGTLAGDDIIQGGCLSVGAEQDAVNNNYEATQTFNGDFAEIIIYSFILPSTQRNIVNNYLSAKYNISITGDKYAGDNSSNGNYDFEVIGIGTESDATHNEAHGSGGLRIKQSTNFGNGDYLLIGHDSTSPQVYTPNEDAGLTANGIDQRWARDWYFDITDAGSSITVDLTFDFTEAEMDSSALPSGTTSDYKLIYRSGTSGNWSIVSSATSKTNSQILFTGQALSNGDGYYTIGTIDDEGSSLPINLISFDAKWQDNNVLLKWQTASELQNDYFIIQHSVDAKSWFSIGVIDGNGTVNTISNYSFVDKNPIVGINYYRFKQVDYDGNYTFSTIKNVNVNYKNKIRIFPNPTDGNILISNLPHKDCELQILDAFGRIIMTMNSLGSNSANMDFINLPKGIYLVKVISSDSIEVIKVLKE